MDRRDDQVAAELERTRRVFTAVVHSGQVYCQPRGQFVPLEECVACRRLVELSQDLHQRTVVTCRAGGPLGRRRDADLA